ncbi:hypothetical protein AD954_05260 [Acetobacter cerevisiae]|uniref:Uncharacterized protein n=1 Tax=Acetobacter cerevisiae TaxID=178900 RepID=A0A149VCM7_9PROT|nr:hypothetical protein AD954_05260 [Acetobacter cerevisiae]
MREFCQTAKQTDVTRLFSAVSEAELVSRKQTSISAIFRFIATYQSFTRSNFQKMGTALFISSSTKRSLSM